MAEQLSHPTLDHWDSGSNSTGGQILSKPKWRFIAQSSSCSPFHDPDMTELLFKDVKPQLIHPPIL